MIPLGLEQKKLLIDTERQIENAIRSFEESTGLTIAEKPTFSRDKDGGLEYVHLRMKGEL